MCVTATDSLLYRVKGRHARDKLVSFLRGRVMFPAGAEVPQGAAIQPWHMAVPKAAKGQHMLPDAVIKFKVNSIMGGMWRPVMVPSDKHRDCRMLVQFMFPRRQYQ